MRLLFAPLRAFSRPTLGAHFAAHIASVSRKHHGRKAHFKEFMEESVKIKESSRNQLWDAEDLGLMAGFEATYVGRNIKQVMQRELFNYKTIESIKGCRKQPRYKKLLDEYKSKQVNVSNVQSNKAEVPIQLSNVTSSKPDLANLETGLGTKPKTMVKVNKHKEQGDKGRVENLISKGWESGDQGRDFEAG